MLDRSLLLAEPAKPLYPRLEYTVQELNTSEYPVPWLLVFKYPDSIRN